jgi:hypothetical protein
MFCLNFIERPSSGRLENVRHIRDPLGQKPEQATRQHRSTVGEVRRCLSQIDGYHNRSGGLRFILPVAPFRGMNSL